MNIKSIIYLGVFLGFTLSSIGQSFDQVMDRGQIKGNFQFDAQYYQEDSLIGALEVPESILSNGFLNLIYTNGNFSTGIRYESYLNALQGYPAGYVGSGISYRFATFKKDKLEVTVGNFYEQFGNGLVLRTYEERGLGYDNALDGMRLKYEITKGINVTGLTGKQRLFFDLGEGIVRGFDAEIVVNDVFSNLSESKTKIIIGGSAVSKYQSDQDSRYILPENVASFAGRLNINRGKINFSGEYAYKVNDPSADNDFIYKSGNAIFLQTAFSQKGLGIVVSAKRNDNMSFRSDRTADQQNLLINYLPALTKQHTYNLLATLYPYATQLNGEVAFQADIIYKVKKNTALGGKKGMGIQINYSSANNIDTTQLNDLDEKRQAYKSDFFSIGESYFKDFNIAISKKFSKKVKGVFTYANLMFNQDIIQGKPGVPNIYADVIVADVTYKLKPKHAIRTEAQILLTEQDQQEWATLLIEYTYSPHWFIALIDQYNFGNKISEQQLHYYTASAGYNNQGTRISLSYGKQRAGIFCVGGVCRNVPASSGLFLSVTSSF